jgi:hypothetical protein
MKFERWLIVSSAREDIQKSGMEETAITKRRLRVFILFGWRPVILWQREKS